MLQFVFCKTAVSCFCCMDSGGYFFTYRLTVNYGCSFKKEDLLETPQRIQTLHPYLLTYEFNYLLQSKQINPTAARIISL